MKKIKSKNFGIIHVNAQCNNCDWVYQEYTNMNKTRYLIRKHIIKTGHVVVIETGTAIQYSLLQEQN